MGILDAIFDGIATVFNAILDPIISALSNLIGTVLFYITSGLMFIVGLLHEMFNVFSGSTKVLFKGKYTYLSDVFFQNESVNNLYWALALLGIVLVIMFSLIAVIRKMFDLEGKHEKQSLGSILGAMFKSIFIMLILSTALSATLNIANVVINRIGYAFDHSDSLSRQQEIQFTDEQIATMGRIYTTIGNYSINPSYDSRYNLNKCYNEIREDLNRLSRQGVFDFVYTTKVNGKEVDTWQSVLQKLFCATNSSQNAAVDRYNEGVSKSLLHIMELLDSNANFYPLSEYKSGYTDSENVGLDRILFLSGTVDAALNEAYNKDPYLLDGLRGAFYTGERSIYSLDDVSEAFNIGVGGISYILIWILAYFTIRNLLRCIFGCISRIFTMVSLYIIAPFVIAPMPLDNGEKFKQWTMAMIIQALNILGLIIPMRLIILFAPIIMSSELVLFDSVVLNFLGKVLLIVGGLEGMSSLSGVITGILANNAGMAAINAGNSASAMGDKVFGVGSALTAKAVKGAAGVAGSVLGGVADVTGLSTVGSKIGEGLSTAKAAVSGAFKNMRENYGGIGALMNMRKGGGGGAKGAGGGLGGVPGLEQFASGKHGSLGGKATANLKKTTPTKPQNTNNSGNKTNQTNQTNQTSGTGTTPKNFQTSGTGTTQTNQTNQTSGTETTQTDPTTNTTEPNTKTDTSNTMDTPKKEGTGFSIGGISVDQNTIESLANTFGGSFGDGFGNGSGDGSGDGDEKDTGKGGGQTTGSSILEQLKDIADPFAKNDPKKPVEVTRPKVGEEDDKKDKEKNKLNEKMQNKKVPPIKNERPK